MPWIYSLVGASAGVTLSVTKDESFGMSVAEAMACECPVVCPNVGALPELLEGDLESSMYPGGEIEAAAERVVSLLDSANERERLLKAGRKRIVERYSLEIVGAQYMELLSGLVDSAPQHVSGA